MPKFLNKNKNIINFIKNENLKKSFLKICILYIIRYIFVMQFMYTKILNYIYNFSNLIFN